MARLEVRLAWILGVALPLAETLRRRTHFDEFAFYVDDYIAGGILLFAAWAVGRRRWYGPGSLVGAWGIVCGGMYSSFFGQLARLQAPDISGLPSWVVAVVKGAAFAVAIASLMLSVRSLRPTNEMVNAAETGAS